MLKKGKALHFIKLCLSKWQESKQCQCYETQKLNLTDSQDIWRYNLLTLDTSYPQFPFGQCNFSISWVI